MNGRRTAAAPVEAALVLAVCGGLALAAGGCGRRDDGSAGGAPPPPSPAAPPAAAAPTVVAADLALRVVAVHRAARDVVQVDLLAVNQGAEPRDLGAALGQQGGLPAASLLSGDGRARVFVLADGQGVPQCSTPAGPLAPGGQQPVYARFPALTPAAHSVTLWVPGIGAFRDLAVPPGDP